MSQPRLTDRDLEILADQFAEHDVRVVIAVRELQDRRKIDRDLVNATPRNARWRGQGRGRK